MRTKTLLLTAAVLAAGLSASVAQSVYSVNAVGYVNVTLKPGYNLVANPLNGTNNAVATVLPAANLPNDTELLTWDHAIQDFAQVEFVFDGVWYDANGNPSTKVLNPGSGFFLKSPVPTDLTITFVGEVPQGTLNNPILQNYGFYSSIVPQSASLSSMGFPANPGMTYQTFDTAIQDYTQVLEYIGVQPGYPTGWADANGNPADPVPNVAQGFLINNPGAAVQWNRTFSVNN